MLKTQQFGTWSSPISAGLRSKVITLNDVKWDTHADTKTLLWAERRGKQGVLMAQSGVDAPYDLTDHLSVKPGVGYGGGEFDVRDGYAYFVANSRIYRQAITQGHGRPITPSFGGSASPVVSPNGQWVAYVHTYDDVDGIALVDAEGKQWPRKVGYGSDFAMQPAWHPESRQLAYVAWDHPNMPWDGTRLHLLTFDDAMRVIANDVIVGDDDISIFQPEFSPDGRYLSYISDESGMGQIYLYDLESGVSSMLTDGESEHGTPAWVQGLRQYAWMPDGTGIVYLQNQRGIIRLWHLDLNDKRHTNLSESLPYTTYQQPCIAPDGTIAVIAESSQKPPCVITLSKDNHPRLQRRSLSIPLPEDYLSIGQPVTWQGHDGEDVHGIYYPPSNPQYDSTGKPPLIVHVHGGPTSQTLVRFEPELQIYTSRGYAVLSVNHRGSTGYGRDYMLKLRGNWGYYDVEDAASGASYLAEQGKADPEKLVILGSSAGGYTVLQSLVDKPGFYKAAICKYGISNQFMLVQDTHKFESRYLDRLFGTLPDAAELYRARSPLFHAEQIVDPIIIFQGTEDTVVPRNQSDMIVESLQARGVPHAYHVFEDEGHGFRKPETHLAYAKAVIDFLKQHVVYD